TVAVNHPVLSAVKTTEKAMSSLQQAGESKNNRINALSAVNVAWDSFRAIDAGLSALGSIQGNTFSDFGISATYGQQKNISTSQSKGSTMASSEINAGGQVNLSAVGNGEISQINVIGSNIAGHLGTNLLSQGDIKIEAIQQTHQERSNNKSTGFNGGVTVSTGGIGFTAGANYGKGYGNGNEVTYTYSHIGSSNSQTTIHSANDVTLKGGQTVGKGVSLTADNLHIESVQETLDYESKQKNVSGSATVGAGASISGGYDSSKMNAHYKNVVEQSGIYAGDDGYQVNIANHTNLVGSLMQSTDKAESNDKNFFSTGTLEYRDLKNTSNYSAEGYSLNAGVSMEGDFRIPFGNNTSSVSNSTQEAQVQTTAKDDQVIQTIAGMGGTAISQAELEKSDTEKERNTGVKLDGLAGVFNQGNWGVAKALAASTLGVVSRDSNETGVTTSSINTKNIVITKGNEAENNAKIADLNKGNIHQSVAKVDIERVKSDFERDLGVAKEFMENLSAIGDKLYYDVEKNEKNILVKYKPENCRNAAEKCVKVFELNLDTLRNRELRKDEAEILSKMYAHGILNTSDLDRVYGSIQYSGKDVLNNASIVVRKPYAGLAEEMSFTIFERLRAGIDMPSVFGASNASRDQATIWDKLNSYNAKNPYERVSLDHVAHSLGASSTKNAMNWAKYKGVDLNETTLKGYVAGTSYPITNKTIGGRLSFGLYDQGYTEKAASLFKDGKVEYAVAPGDIVGTGIGLPYLPGSWSLGIGNTNTTGDNFPRIPGRILTGDHNVAYYKDEEVIKFFMPDRDKFNEIKNYQEKTWGKIGPKMETLPFRNKEVIKI
ncbi:TPA: hemagglutinin repeat-containing protein, partial [Mannheimia haemolytica]